MVSYWSLDWADWCTMRECNLNTILMILLCSSLIFHICKCLYLEHLPEIHVCYGKINQRGIFLSLILQTLKMYAEIVGQLHEGILAFELGLWVTTQTVLTGHDQLGADEVLETILESSPHISAKTIMNVKDYPILLAKRPMNPYLSLDLWGISRDSPRKSSMVWVVLLHLTHSEWEASFPLKVHWMSE